MSCIEAMTFKSIPMAKKLRTSSDGNPDTASTCSTSRPNPLRQAARTSRGFPGEPAGRLTEHLQRLGEAPLDGGEVELLLRPEQAEEVRLRDPRASRDLVGRRAVEPALREQVLRGGDDLLAPFLGGESLSLGRVHVE
jgi:hypothetical protein